MSHIFLLRLWSNSNSNKSLLVSVGSSGHNLERFINLEHFGMYCVHPVYSLHKSIEFHHMWIECQRIIIHFLLIISYPFISIAKLSPLPYSLPNLSPIYQLSLPGNNFIRIRIFSSLILSAQCRSLELVSLGWLRRNETNVNICTMTPAFIKKIYHVSLGKQGFSVKST